MASARSIVLIGMMGAGKSSVGRCLERRTGLRRFDTDELVIQRFGKTILQIFAELGEEAFRSAETDALAALPVSPPSIIVTGGGIVLRPENLEHLRRLGVVVWLDAEEETLYQRATRRRTRPLLKTENPRVTLTEIATARAPLYGHVSEIRIDTTSRSHEQVADAILSEIESRSIGGS
jgi:shikimate kinase